MKTTIKVAVAYPLSITMSEGIVSTEKRIRMLGRSSTFVETEYPSEFYIALTDGDKVIYELPVSEDMSMDFLNKLLEHFGLSREGKRNKWD